MMASPLWRRLLLAAGILVAFLLEVLPAAGDPDAKAPDDAKAADTKQVNDKIKEIAGRAEVLKAVRKHLSDAELKANFDLGHHFKHVDTIFKRVFGTK